MERIRYRFVYNRRNRLNNQGKALIQIEASLNKRKVYFTTRTYVRPDEWDKRTATIVNHPHSIELNAWIYEYMIQLEEIELSVWKRGGQPTLSLLKENIKSNRAHNVTFNDFSLSVISNSSRKPGTKDNLKGTLKILYSFRPGYTWNDLTYSFMRDFEKWLIGRGLAVNTVAKHLRNMRTLINEAISYGYISCDSDPFKKFSIKHERTPHRYLTPEELNRIENVKLDGKLAHVRDAFLFCCYTGLRFSDFIKLDDSCILKQGKDTWLVVKTQKTGADVKVPISLSFEGRPLEIIRQYGTVSKLVCIGCNADTNRKLSEVQSLAKIKTRTTFHTARHTCATLLCYQGVPITTVQKILGHTKLSTTQLYSEVMSDTVKRDLKRVNKNKYIKDVRIGLGR